MAAVSLRAENVVFPPDAFAIGDGPGVVDVTKPPYNADNTGKTDVTEALRRAYADIWKADKKNPPRGGWGPHRIMYFPNGTYKVSGSIEYPVERKWNSNPRMEMNNKIHFQGQSRAGTIIRLVDRAPGFGDARAPLPVVSFIKAGRMSNVAMMNTVANLTIQTGAGNPGAIGLRFHDNNCGSVRDVTIEGAGAVGLDLSGGLTGLGYIKNVAIKGFDRGVRLASTHPGYTFEHLQLTGQRVAGIEVSDNHLTVRDLRSVNTVPAIVTVNTDLAAPRNRAHVTILDSELIGGAATASAIDNAAGFLFARDIRAAGYGSAIRNRGKLIPGANVDEFVSDNPVTVDGKPARSLCLAIEEAPDGPVDELKDWASVTQFGAKPDDDKDDTAAVQAAMDSGKSTVYFPRGQYDLSAPVRVGKNVRRVQFLWSRIRPAPKGFKNGDAVFKIVDGAAPAVVLENLAYGGAGDFYWFEQATKRTVILRDIFIGGSSACFKGAVPGAKLFVEMAGCSSRNQPGFALRGTQAWMRAPDVEGTEAKFLNDGGALWVLGFKTEQVGIDFHTRNGGRTEVLGGTINRYSGTVPAGQPSILTENAAACVVASENVGTGKRTSFNEIMVRELRAGQIREIRRDRFPKRGTDATSIALPLYVTKE